MAGELEVGSRRTCDWWAMTMTGGMVPSISRGPREVRGTEAEREEGRKRKEWRVRK